MEVMLAVGNDQMKYHCVVWRMSMFFVLVRRGCRTKYKILSI